MCLLETMRKTVRHSLSSKLGTVSQEVVTFGLDMNWHPWTYSMLSGWS